MCGNAKKILGLAITGTVLGAGALTTAIMLKNKTNKDIAMAYDEIAALKRNCDEQRQSNHELRADICEISDTIETLKKDVSTVEKAYIKTAAEKKASKAKAKDEVKE